MWLQETGISNQISSSNARDGYLHQKLTDILPLITLQLNHLSILGMLDHGTIAGEFLWSQSARLAKRDDL